MTGTSAGASDSAPGPAAVDWQRYVEAWNTTEPPTPFPRRRDPESRGRFDRWAREVLPPVGGTVLDVGCGDGRAALALVPPASEVIGVDRSGAALDRFVAAANEAGVARRTVHGHWPDVAVSTPVADVVVCRDVLYAVADIVPFLLALTTHARLAVVVEVSARHPFDAWREAWRHVRDGELPSRPTADDLLGVVRELGLDPEVVVEDRSAPVDLHDPAAVDLVRTWLDPEGSRAHALGAWLAEHLPERQRSFAVLRWPGLGEA